MPSYWLDTDSGKVHKGYPDNETECGEDTTEGYARASHETMIAGDRCVTCFGYIEEEEEDEEETEE